MDHNWYVFLKNNRVVIAFYSVITSLAIVIGGAVYADNSVNQLFASPVSVLFTVGKLVAVGVISGLFYAGSAVVLWRYRDKQDGARKQGIADISFRQYVLLRWAFGILIFALDLVVLLAYFPGIFSYDMIVQTDEALGFLPMDRFQPPFHTFLWKLCLGWGGLFGSSLEQTIEKGITIYGVLQGMLYAYVLSGLCMMVIQMHLKKWIKIILLLFLICNPVVLIFAIIPAKDAMFACFFAQMTKHLLMLGHNEAGEQKLHVMIWLAAEIVLCCLLRNNAVYVMILLILFTVVRYGFKKKERLVAFAVAVLLFLCINGPVYTAMGIGKGDLREALSLPLQQITHVYVSENQNIPEDLVKGINRFLPVDRLNSVFNPRFADYVKELADEDAIKNHFGDFLKLYGSLLVRYPDNYLNEMLALHVSGWYPFAHGIDAFSNRQYIETFISDYPKAQPVRASKIPGVYAMLEKVSDYSAFEHVPVVRVLFSTQIPIWGILLGVFFLRVTGRSEKIVAFVPAILLWMTYLAGPVTCMRYVFPLAMIQPLVWAVVLETDRR